MQTSHPINTQFTESLLRVQSVSAQHPLLSAKADIVSQMQAQRVEQVPSLVNQFSMILTNERSLWNNISMRPSFTPFSTVFRLDKKQKAFVLANARDVRRVCGTAFEKLERASIHEQVHYDTISEDYAMFQQIVEGLHQLDVMHTHLDRQELLAARVSAHLNAADDLHPKIEDLRASLLDQQVIASRLPQFTIPKGALK